MDGASFLAYVKRQFKRTDKDTELYECMTDTIVDMRLRMVSDDYSIVSTTLAADPSLAIGTYMLTLPTDFGHLAVDNVQIRDTSSDDTYNPLKKISKSEYDDKYSENYSTSTGDRLTGVPVHFSYYGKKLYVGPALDRADYEFKINYTTNGVTDIVAGTTTVPFTDQYRKIVRDGTLMNIYAMMENFDESAAWEKKYEEGLAKIINNDNYNKADRGPIQMCGVMYA